MKKILFSLGMLLLTVAAYADGTILFSTAKAASMSRLIAYPASLAATADALLRVRRASSAAPTPASDASTAW